MSVLYIRNKNGKFVAVPMLKGKDGKSAYEIALNKGFEGSEEDWIESLRGSDYILTEADKQDIAQMSCPEILTAIDANSTDEQVPSAKAVYDIVGDIETTLDSIIAIQENLIGGATE